MKLAATAAILLSFLLLGCVLSPGQDEEYYYNKAVVPAAELPKECAAKEECPLLSCLTASCSCEGALFHSKMAIYDARDAKMLADYYLGAYSKKCGITKAEKLNPAFYQITCDELDGSKTVFAVGADGTVLDAKCN